jgi:hypothetical protein
MRLIQHNLTLLVFSAVFGLFFCVPALSATELPAPTIVINPDVYYPLDEVLYLEGRAKPDSSIELLLQKSGSRPIRAVTRSDSRGEWVFAQKLPLDAGNWEVRARVVDGDNVSEWSNPRIVRAISTGLIIGGVTIKFSVLVFVIIVLLVVGALGALYYSRRVKAVIAWHEAALREKEREVLETEMEHEFYEIRQKIMRELEHLEKKIEDGKFTDEEKKESLERREELLRELKESERSLEKKIKETP